MPTDASDGPNHAQNTYGTRQRQRRDPTGGEELADTHRKMIGSSALGLYGTFFRSLLR